jgi:hypothetical protein
VRRFRRGAIDDTVTALEAAGVRARVVGDADAAAAWCTEHDLRSLLRPWTPVGPVRDAIAPVLQRLQEEGREQHDLLRGWDARAWPHAGKGFFPFRRRIPELLEAEGLV